ncbi:hypothetical protein Tco_1280220 [Tanacetum coccineum]
MKELRRSGRVKCKGPIVEENTVDDAYSIKDESSGDDFVKAAYVKGKGIEFDDNGKKGTKCDIGVAKKRKKSDIIGDDNEKDKKVKRENGESSSSGTTKRLKTKKKKPYVFQTRTSPKALYNAIVTLKPIQKSWLARIGFADVLEFKCDGIPSKMGFYVVDNFIQHKMEIKLNERSTDFKSMSCMNRICLMCWSINLWPTLRWVLCIDNFSQHNMEIKQRVKNANDEEMDSKTGFDQLEKGKTLLRSVVKFLIRKSKGGGHEFQTNFLCIVHIVMGGMGNGEISKGLLMKKKSDPMPEDEDERNGFERTFAAADVVFRGNTLIADVYQHYREALNYKDEISEGKSCSKLSGYNNEEPHEKEVFTMVDKVVDEFHSSKKQNDFEAPSFSLRVTQDFEMVLSLESPITDTHTHALGSAHNLEPVQAVSLSMCKPVLKGEDLGNSRGNRKYTKSQIARSPFRSRVIDINAVEFKEEKKVETYLLKKMGIDQSEVLFATESGTMAFRLKSENSMSRFFLLTFTVVDKTLFGIEAKVNESMTKFLLDVEKVNERGGRKSIIKQFDLYPTVNLIDSKNNQTKNGYIKSMVVTNTNDMVVATVLQKGFSKYLVRLNHNKAADVLKVEVK